MPQKPHAEALEIKADPVIEEYIKGLDLTLLRENLQRTVDERVQALISMHEFYEEAQKSRRNSTR